MGRLSRVILCLSIATASASAQQAPARTLVEEFRIDGVENELTAILGLIVTGNGNVIIAQRGDFAVTVFAPSGTVEKRLARKGSGPGEVQGFYAFGMLVDTLWIIDSGLNRISLFGPDWTVARTVPITGSVDWTKLRPDAPGAFAGRVLPRVLLPGDVALARAAPRSQALADRSIASVPLVRMSWDGTGSRIVTESPVGSIALPVKNGATVVYTGQPFRASPFMEMSNDGRQIALIEARESPDPVIRITRFNTAGDTIARAQIPYVPVPITPRNVDSAVTAIARAFRMPENESAIRAAVTVPKSYYPVDKALVANDGTVWLRARDADGRRRWTVVSPAGRIVETLMVPAVTDVLWIDGSIWGTTRDADDVPSVVRLRRR